MSVLKKLNSGIIAAGGIIGLFLKRGSAGMGLEGHLFRYDAIHGYPINRTNSDLFIPTDCIMASKLHLRSIGTDHDNYLS